MKHTEGIDPATGEYFYREHKKRKPPQQHFQLDFENCVSQLEGKVTNERLNAIVEMLGAMNKLRALGCLPDNHYRRLQRQINSKAQQAVARFKKQQKI